jgi:hypothetical protein
MTVKRQYILPNCNLTLEGLTAGDEADPMSPLTVLLNSEFMFPALGETLSGGREFLEHMWLTVSEYAQSILSGIPRPTGDSFQEGKLVTLLPTENQRHQLQAKVTNANGDTTVKKLDLTSVQLFDLMEALDQLVADTLTLPDMTLSLSPLHRRYARPLEPTSQKAAPIALGLSALAASAAVLFMVPVPEVEPHRTTKDQEASLSATEDASPETPTPAPPAESDSLPAGSNPQDSEADAIAPTSPEAAETEPTPTTPRSIEDLADATGPVEAATALTRLSTAPSITDSEALDDLAENLETDLEEALPDPVGFTEPLIYRVAVSEMGDLLGYKYESDAALLNVALTPLPTLTYIPVDPTAARQEPVAQFRITFEPDGTVQVQPVDPATTE